MPANGLPVLRSSAGEASGSPASVDPKALRGSIANLKSRKSRALQKPCIEQSTCSRPPLQILNITDIQTTRNVRFLRKPEKDGRTHALDNQLHKSPAIINTVPTQQVLRSDCIRSQMKVMGEYISAAIEAILDTPRLFWNAAMRYAPRIVHHFEWVLLSLICFTTIGYLSWQVTTSQFGGSLHLAINIMLETVLEQWKIGWSWLTTVFNDVLVPATDELALNRYHQRILSTVLTYACSFSMIRSRRFCGPAKVPLNRYLPISKLVSTATEELAQASFETFRLHPIPYSLNYCQNEAGILKLMLYDYQYPTPLAQETNKFRSRIGTVSDDLSSFIEQTVDAADLVTGQTKHLEESVTQLALGYSTSDTALLIESFLRQYLGLSSPFRSEKHHTSLAYHQWLDTMTEQVDAIAASALALDAKLDNLQHQITAIKNTIHQASDTARSATQSQNRWWHWTPVAGPNDQPLLRPLLTRLHDSTPTLDQIPIIRQHMAVVHTHYKRLRHTLTDLQHRIRRQPSRFYRLDLTAAPVDLRHLNQGVARLEAAKRAIERIRGRNGMAERRRKRTGGTTVVVVTDSAQLFSEGFLEPRTKTSVAVVVAGQRREGTAAASTAAAPVVGI